MEAVCSGKLWDVAIAYDGGRLTGFMPYHFGRRLGMTYIIEPQLTQYSGPFYCYPDGLSESHRLDFEKQTARSLVSQMEAIKPAYILQRLSPDVTNWLPFHWSGYRQTTRYTYRIGDISDPQRVFDAFDAEKRQRKIRRYEQSVAVSYDMSPLDFARFHNRYWMAKGGHDVLSTDFIENVCRTAVERGSGLIASLRDDAGRLLAARFVAFDARCAYALMSAQDLQLHKSGHSEMLYWAILQHLSGKSHAFDFEGSMDEGLEYFYRSFGAVQTPYSEISKCNSILFRLLLKMKKS